MTDDLQLGDIVFLNSGSPPLQVEAIEGDRITVSWSGRDIGFFTFARACLRFTDPEPPCGC